MKLQIRDCIYLYDFYRKNPYDAAYPENTPGERLRKNRAISLGLVNESGGLNLIQGKLVLDNFTKKLPIYMRGVKWRDYFEKHKESCLSFHGIIPKINHKPWMCVRLTDSLPYITNWEAIIAGRLIDNKGRVTMKIKKNDSKNGDKFIRDRCLEWDATWVEVRPHTFCWDILKGRELIWLTDATQELWIPVQAPYIHFVLKRFTRRINFYVRDSASFVIAKAPLTRKILMFKKVAACIQTLGNVGDFSFPDRIDAGWEGDFAREEGLLV